MTTPTILVHGGLGSEKNFKEKQKKSIHSIKHIIQLGYNFLCSHSAVETAIYVTTLLEDDPLYNAGTGSTIQSDGIIRMSASLMDGKTKTFSGVMNISNIKNPIMIAQALQKEKDRVLAGEPAGLYANRLGIPAYNPETPEQRQKFDEGNPDEKPTSTVGCVVLDQNGYLAAATSTGGKGWEIPGRVSDSATVAGNYANLSCAVSATGVGEDIMNVGLACNICTRVSDGFTLADASKKILQELGETKGTAGFIGLTLTGESIATAVNPYMFWAKASEKSIELFSPVTS